MSRVCPRCGYEYEPWVEVCPDCNVSIEARRGDSRGVAGKLGDGNPQWTVVGNVPNAIIGNLIKSQLEDAGIPVLLMRSNSVDVAEFSHNDYVSHDLRVPFDRLREARQLMDAPPDSDPLGAMWEDYSNSQDDPGDAYEREGMRAGVSGATLPEGWSVLPTEADLQARQRSRRTMKREPEDWYWSDQRKTDQQEQPPEFDPHWQSLYDRSLGSNPPAQSERDPKDTYGTYRIYGDAREKQHDPYAPSKWVRVIYAILMLAMSLPFIFSLLQNIWSFGR